MPVGEGAVDRDVLRQKVQFVLEHARMLRELAGRSHEDFVSDWTLQAAATRGLQVAIEAHQLTDPREIARDLLLVVRGNLTSPGA
jgi:hypothetical protein